MASRKNMDQEVNFVGTSLVDFVEYYNSNIPKGFPRATQKDLEKFKEEYPGLFDEKGAWTIDKHRKKLMDWLSSYRRTA